jgi:hypothetical protein
MTALPLRRLGIPPVDIHEYIDRFELNAGGKNGGG